MKIIPTIKVYLILLSFIVLGYIFMVLPDLFLPPPIEGEFNEINNFLFQFSVLTLITITNFVTAYKLNLKREFSEFWSIKKLGLFPIGLMVGIFVMSLPLVIGLLTNKASWSDLELPKVNPIAIVFILIMTLWEELWFRGIFLNYAKRYLSILQVSLFMGFLFMISYSIYSKGNFIVVAPNFLLLGMLFILLYFFFKTNWLTYGMMLGINIATLSSPFENDWLIGKFGILSAILWGILLMLIIKKYGENINTSPKMAPDN